MNVAPGATFEGYSPELASGLTGTVGVRIRDGAGADFLARTTASITADVTVGATSVYRRSFTAPTAAGQYWIVWDTGTVVADPQELVVTYTPLVAPTGSLYITRDEMRAALSYTAGATYADAEIDRACVAVSRAIDRACGTTRRFYQATETRYYTPDEYWHNRYAYSYARDCRIEIDDLTSASSVTIDTGGNGTYATTWVEGTDFFFDPPNAALDGEPYIEMVVRYFVGRYFPAVQRAVKITGIFGWPSVPTEVSQYALIFAAQLVMRSRQAPFGILMQGMEVGAMARLMRVDPDFQRLIGPFVKSRPFL